jgi:hypothetical protein
MKNFKFNKNVSLMRRLRLLEKKLTILENQKDNSIFSNVSLAELKDTAIQTEGEWSEISEDTLVSEDLPVKKLPLFQYSFFSFSVIAYYACKLNPSLIKKLLKTKEKTNLSKREEIWSDFTEWWNSIACALYFYLVFYFFSKMTIDYFIKPKMPYWLEKHCYLTLSIAIFYYGYLFVLDGDITASLKTPQQSLSIKLSNSQLPKSKSLLSKVQEITEYFKENFKKFGILVNSAMIVDLLGLYKSYLVIGFGVPVIWDIIKFFSLYWGMKEELDDEEKDLSKP